MFVYAVQNPKSTKREAVLRAAEKCCEIEKMLAGENNRMAQRYAVALEVLISPAQMLSDWYSRVYYVQGLSRQVKSRLETIDHDNKHLGGDSSNTGSTTTTPLQPPFVNDQHQHPSLPPHLPLVPLSTLSSQSQFSPASSESSLFHAVNEDPEQFQLGLDQGGLTESWESGEGVNISEIFLRGLGEDSTFQGLDATVSGGYLFGWPNGPVY